jgi:hypothetical protein
VTGGSNRGSTVLYRRMRRDRYVPGVRRSDLQGPSRTYSPPKGAARHNGAEAVRGCETGGASGLPLARLHLSGHRRTGSQPARPPRLRTSNCPEEHSVQVVRRGLRPHEPPRCSRTPLPHASDGCGGVTDRPRPRTDCPLRSDIASAERCSYGSSKARRRCRQTKGHSYEAFVAPTPPRVRPPERATCGAGDAVLTSPHRTETTHIRLGGKKSP